MNETSSDAPATVHAAWAAPADEAAAAGIGQHDHFLRLMFFLPSDAIGAFPRFRKPARPPRPAGVLPQSRLQADAGYHLPDPTVACKVRADSPAIEVMTDLRRVAAVTIGRLASIDEANQAMIAHGVRALIVVDDSRRVLGIVTASDVLGERPIQLTQQRGIHHDEIMVRDIMTTSEWLEVIDLDDVLHAQVNHVVATLKRAGRQHALVVDQAMGGRQMVRGIFSLTQIARQLGIALQTPQIGNTFAEIEAAIGT